MTTKLAAAALSLAALTGMTPTVVPVAAAPGIVIVAPAQQSPAKVTPAIAISARDEMERVDELLGGFDTNRRTA